MKKKTILSVILTFILTSTFLGCQSKGDNSKATSNSTSTASDATNNKEASSNKTQTDNRYPDDTQTSDKDKLYLLSCIIGVRDVLKDGYVSGNEISSLSGIIKNLQASESNYGLSNHKVNSDLITIIGQLAKISKDMDNGLNAENQKSIVLDNLKISLNNFYLKNYKTKDFSSIVSTAEEMCKVKITFDSNSTFQDIKEFSLT